MLAHLLRQERVVARQRGNVSPVVVGRQRKVHAGDLRRAADGAAAGVQDADATGVSVLSTFQGSDDVRLGTRRRIKAAVVGAVGEPVRELVVTSGLGLVVVVGHEEVPGLVGGLCAGGDAGFSQRRGERGEGMGRANNAGNLWSSSLP